MCLFDANRYIFLLLQSMKQNSYSANVFSGKKCAFSQTNRILRNLKLMIIDISKTNSTLNRSLYVICNTVIADHISISKEVFAQSMSIIYGYA